MTKGGFSVNTGLHLLLAPINGRLFGCSDRNLFSSQIQHIRSGYVPQPLWMRRADLHTTLSIPIRHMAHFDHRLPNLP